MSRWPLLRALRVALVVLTLSALAGPPAWAQQAEADLILHSGRIWTGDDARPWAEAVAVLGDRIVAVGADADVMPLRGDDTRMVDLGGRFLSPGFIDNHTHFNRAGELLLGVNLLEVSDAQGLVREIRETADRLPEGAWMVGGMWGAYEQWAVSSTGRDEDLEEPESLFRPDRTVIDSVSPRTPALLWNWDRSQILANGVALDAAGGDLRRRGFHAGDGALPRRISVRDLSQGAEGGRNAPADRHRQIARKQRTD